MSEPSPTKNLGEYSDTQAIHAHFCPNFQPIYQHEMSSLLPTEFTISSHNHPLLKGFSRLSIVELLMLHADCSLLALKPAHTSRLLPASLSQSLAVLGENLAAALIARAGICGICVSLLMQNLSFAIVPSKIANGGDAMSPSRKIIVKCAKARLLASWRCSTVSC